MVSLDHLPNHLPSVAAPVQVHSGQLLHVVRHGPLCGQLREPAVRAGAQAAVLPAPAAASEL